MTLTVGQSGVTGVGTAWTAAINGLKLYRPGDSVIYTVTYVGSTALALDRAYEGNGIDAAGTVYAGAAYVLMQNVYALPADCRSIVTILDPVTGCPLTPFSKDQLDVSCGPRTMVNDPTSYAPYDDSSEANPPVLHQVEFFPPPLHARGLALEYLRAAFGFDGSNTTAAPLPWVSASVLLYGCRADVAAYLATQGENAGPHLATAKMYEAKFQEELARLLRVEHQQRRLKVKIEMHQRFTRHRLAWGAG